MGLSTLGSRSVSLRKPPEQSKKRRVVEGRPLEEEESLRQNTTQASTIEPLRPAAPLLAFLVRQTLPCVASSETVLIFSAKVSQMSFLSKFPPTTLSFFHQNYA